MPAFPPTEGVAVVQEPVLSVSPLDAVNHNNAASSAVPGQEQDEKNDIDE